MDLTGKWRYIENYGYGVAEGELYLKQKGQTLAGRIVFTDKVEGREFLYDTRVFKRRTGRT